MRLWGRLNHRLSHIDGRANILYLYAIGAELWRAADTFEGVDTQHVSPAPNLGAALPTTRPGRVLELAFSTQELRALCETETAAERRLGAIGSAALRNRLADLRAASNVAELLELAGSRRRNGPAKDQLTIDLADGVVLVFGPNQVKTPRTTSRGVDWSQVSRVKILRVGRNDA
jgi:hypothetical protein